MPKVHVVTNDCFMCNKLQIICHYTVLHDDGDKIRFKDYLFMCVTHSESIYD